MIQKLQFKDCNEHFIEFQIFKSMSISEASDENREEVSPEEKGRIGLLTLDSETWYEAFFTSRVLNETQYFIFRISCMICLLICCIWTLVAYYNGFYFTKLSIWVANTVILFFVHFFL